MKNLFISAAVSAFFKRRISYLIFFVTSHCNARCKMCFNENIRKEQAGEDDLTLDEIRKITERFPHFLHLAISGGEPFLRDDLADVIGLFYKNCGIKSLTISTNGLVTGTITKTVSKILTDYSDIKIAVSLSIDAIGKKHDEIRDVENAYEKVKSTYKNMLKLKEKHANLKLDAATVLSYFNKNEIMEILKKIKKEFNFDYHEVILARGRALFPEALKVEPEVYEEAHKWLMKNYLKPSSNFYFNLNHAVSAFMRSLVLKILKNKIMPVKCQAGAKMLIMESNGDILPCEMLQAIYSDKALTYGLKNFIIGNLRECGYDIFNIINSKKYDNILKFISEGRCVCTFECALTANIVFTPLCWLKMGLYYFFLKIKKDAY